VRDLMTEIGDVESEPFDGLPDGTVMGHVHLRVAAIPDTVRFYRDVLGFALMAQLGPYAAFLAAGGYHHHLGANTWESRGAPAAPADTARLRHFAIVFPDAAARDEAAARVGAGDDGFARDPSGNAFVLDVADGA
jgi:catechol 2,3-dioxygenase